MMKINTKHDLRLGLRVILAHLIISFYKHLATTKLTSSEWGLIQFCHKEELNKKFRKLLSVQPLPAVQVAFKGATSGISFLRSSAVAA